MDTNSLIAIAVAIIVIYFLLKFIISPIIRIISGVIIILLLFYVLQRFFGFNVDQVLAPFGISLNSNKWGLNLNWVLGPVNYYINQIESFFRFIWENFPKNK